MRRWKVLLLAAMVPLLGAAPADEADRARRAFERAMIDVHNDARDAVRVPPLAWDDKLANDAQDWADHLARTRRFEHSAWPRGHDPAGEGENLFTGTAGGYSYAEMVGLWVAEKRSFINQPIPGVSTTGRWQDVGHYTQLVWRGTTRVGCGLATSGGQDYLVCRYSPPGNVWGQKAF